MKLEQVEGDELHLSVIHISSIISSNAQKLKDSWKCLIVPRDKAEYIVDASDTFRVETVSTEKSAVNGKSKETLPATDRSKKRDLCILFHVQDVPTHEETPFLSSSGTRLPLCLGLTLTHLKSPSIANKAALLTFPRRNIFC
jgi:hypothetical protein